MAENKTQPTNQSVESFLNAVENEQRKKDGFEVLEMMKKITGEEPVLWGPSLIGFGNYHYKYESGREGDFFRTGFSPRKTALTLYIMSGFSRYEDLMQKLGKYKTGKSCLYVKKLDDVDREVLTELIEESLKFIKEKYG
ncbi:MAG: DUF1801 domain-containing protein [Vicingaceae bacterium]